MTHWSNSNKINILIVEDNDLNSEILVDMLESLGYDCSAVSSGPEALTVLADSSVDYFHLILSDIAMPDMNGYVLAQSIRSLHRKDLSTLPIIAVTGESEAEVASNYRNYGIDDYILKPLDLQILKASLKRWLKHSIPPH